MSGKLPSPGHLIIQEVKQLIINKWILNLDKLVIQLEASKDLIFNSKYITNKYGTKLKESSFKVADGVYLTTSTFKDADYLYSFNLDIDSVRVGIISTDNRDGSQTVKFSFSNQILYTAPSWYYFYQKLVKHLPLCFNLISAYDIALDYQTVSGKLLAARLFKIDKDCSWNSSKVLPNPLYQPAHKSLKCAKMQTGASFIIGNRNNSGKEIAVYIKSDEIEGKVKVKANDGTGYKEYISRLWEANGFNLEQDTERIEARFRRKYDTRPGNTDAPPTLEDLNNSERLGQVFLNGVGNVFSFKELLKPRVYDANRNKVYPSFSLIALPDMQTQAGTPRFAWKETESPRAQKRRTTAKELLSVYIQTGDMETLKSLKNYTQKNLAPRKTDWPRLLARYAKDYEGVTSEEIRQRMGEFQG